MLRRILGLWILACAGWLHAQDEPVKMTPEFALTFPVVKVGRDVTVQYPVFLNPSTILKPGMVMRVIYLPPNPSESINLGIAHKGTMEEAYSRPASTGGGDDGPQMSPETMHAIEKERRTVWTVLLDYQLAMAQFPTDDIHLIYSPTGKDQDLDDQRFNFFDGMLIGLPNGKVTVLAVEKKSRADVAGIKAGDEILAVGSTPIKGDLTAFATSFAAAKTNAEETNATTYPISVAAPGAPARTALLNMPPTLKNNLMQGF